MSDGLTLFRRKGTIARAWSNTKDYNIALRNWTKTIILAAKEKRCAHTKDECVVILAKQGIITTSNALRQLSSKKRLSHVIVKRFYAGQSRRVELLDPKEIAKYYTETRGKRGKNKPRIS